MALIADERRMAENETEGMDIFLQAGELYFGNAPTRISTMLHSRTVITFWHPGTQIGGMCHIVKIGLPLGDRDMQYADFAIDEFSNLANKYQLPKEEFEVRIFDGKVNDEKDARQHEIILDSIRILIKQLGFNIKELDGFASCSRKIILDLATGVVIKKEIGAPAEPRKEKRIKTSSAEEFAMEIFLHPGEIYFGKAPTIISTLLGSCVAATIWHPNEHLGGMCHIVLPESPGGKCEMRYGDCAIGEFVKQITRFSTRTSDYVVNIYGGSDMFPGMEKSPGMKIGERNIDKVKQLLELYKFKVSEIDTGGSYSRKIRLDLSDGSVGVRKHDKPAEG